MVDPSISGVILVLSGDVLNPIFRIILMILSKFYQLIFVMY